MKHTFDLTRWDAIVGNMFTVTVFSRFIPSFIILVSAYATYVNIEWMVFLDTKTMAILAALSMVIHITYFLLLMFLISVFLIIFNPKLKYGVLGEHVLEVTDAGLLESTAFNETFFKWEAVTKVKRYFRRHFIFISGANYLIVHDRSFPTKQEAIAFAELIRQHVNKSANAG